MTPRRKGDWPRIRCGSHEQRKNGNQTATAVPKAKNFKNGSLGKSRIRRLLGTIVPPTQGTFEPVKPIDDRRYPVIRESAICFEKVKREPHRGVDISRHLPCRRAVRSNRGIADRSDIARPIFAGLEIGIVKWAAIATASGAIDVRRYRGKVLYVNFFASWCPPCNREAPLLAVLARKYASRGLVVLGIDEGEDAGHALGFRKRYGLPYAIALDPSSSAEAPFGEASLPMHVFFDRSGALTVTQSGVLDATSAASTIELLLDAAS